MSAKCFNNLSELPASWIPPSIHLSHSNLFFSLHLYCWQAVGLRWKWPLKFHWLCRCFLLTPKLLPNLEYTEACTILNVMNGPYIGEAASGMFPCIHDQLFKKLLVLRVPWSIGSQSPSSFQYWMKWSSITMFCFVNLCSLEGWRILGCVVTDSSSLTVPTNMGSWVGQTNVNLKYTHGCVEFRAASLDFTVISLGIQFWV
jgi:hypothetical protein